MSIYSALSNKYGAGVPERLGDLELLVMLAVVRLGDREAYGVAVQREIATRAGRHPSFPTIYTTLGRLEEKGLVASRLGEPSPERGGRRKKHFLIRPAGWRALRATLDAVRGMTRGLDPSWETP
jgi:PadR family transcriptional regulator